MTIGQSENFENRESGTIDSPTKKSGTAMADKRSTSAPLARRSTGPRTQRGKEKSKHNALKYGIFSKVVVLPNESRAEVDVLLLELRNYLQPEGALEEILVDKLTALFWRQRRLLIAEVKARGVDLSELGCDAPAPMSDALIRYETTLDRAIDRVLTQLERYQRMRLGQPVLPPINLNVSS